MLLTKHHGLGNDFLVVLDECQPRPVTVGPDDARRLCDRHRGIGADGLLHGAPSDDPDVDVVMVLHNADGSRAEMSGNGIRCFVQAVALARNLTTGSLRVATDAGVREATFAPGATDGQLDVTVDMGVAAPGPAVPAELADALPRHATADFGNPHLVVFVDEPPEGDHLASEGSAAEGHFEAGINVEFVRIDADDALTLTVWERGAGITEACGTGACASAWVAHQAGFVGDEVRVTMPGGAASVRLGEGDTVTLVGPAELIAEIRVP